MKRLIFKSVVAVAAMAALGLASAQERTLKMNLNGPDNHPAAVDEQRNLRFPEQHHVRIGGGEYARAGRSKRHIESVAQLV